jgi:hypothetical protein
MPRMRYGSRRLSIIGYETLKQREELRRAAISISGTGLRRTAPPAGGVQGLWRGGKVSCFPPYTLHPRRVGCETKVVGPVGCETKVVGCEARCRVFHPTPYALLPTLYTLHPTPYTLHPTPYTLHPAPCTLHPTPMPPDLNDKCRRALYVSIGPGTQVGRRRGTRSLSLTTPGSGVLLPSR